jgi:hypothetical protein
VGRAVTLSGASTFMTVRTPLKSMPRTTPNSAASPAAAAASAPPRGRLARLAPGAAAGARARLPRDAGAPPAAAPTLGSAPPAAAPAPVAARRAGSSAAMRWSKMPLLNSCGPGSGWDACSALP